MEKTVSKDMNTKDMGTILFIRFHLPRGRQNQEAIRRPIEITRKADEILKTGGRFTCEVLATGVVSLAYEKDNDDLDIEFSKHGDRDALMAAVDTLVVRIHSRLFGEKTSIQGDRFKLVK